MAWLKKNARLLVFVGLALGAGLVSGILIQRAAGKDVLEDPSPGAEPVGQIGKQSILPTTVVEVSYNFLLCGHTLEQEEMDGEYTGCTSEDIQKRYVDARVLELTAEKR